jgi:acetyl esterase
VPLHPQAQAVCDLTNATRVPVAPEERVQTTREGWGLYLAMTGGEPQPVHAVEDRDANGVPVRLYHPSAATNLPIFVVFHGGGWVIGNVEQYDGIARWLANASGALVVSVDYRLAPEHPFPAALHDTYGTLAWLERYGEAFDGDGRVVAGGQSSGANLVAAACLMARDRGGPRVTRQVLCYPWLDLGTDSESHRRFDGADGVVPTRSQWYRSQYLAGQAVTPYAAPLTADDLAGLPPALILGAGLDPLRDDARRYAQRLQESGVASTYLEYENSPHAFLNFPGALSVAWRAMQDIADDLATVVSA